METKEKENKPKNFRMQQKQSQRKAYNNTGLFHKAKNYLPVTKPNLTLKGARKRKTNEA